MARILITAGPTRQYLDPVRYLTNASSGRMGCALAEAALRAGHEVVIVSGPVTISYPSTATVIDVISTEQMLEAASDLFPSCDGVIGVAAPCDYRPLRVESRKISKAGQPLVLHLVETPDVLGHLGAQKQAHQWVVGFALETHDHHQKAVHKLRRKKCDLIVINSPDAMHAAKTEVEILDAAGVVVASAKGPKSEVATEIMATIQRRWLPPRSADEGRPGSTQNG